MSETSKLKKYLSMTEEEFVKSQSFERHYGYKLDSYTPYILKELNKYPFLSAYAHELAFEYFGGFRALVREHGFGEMSFNIQVPEREVCLKSLYDNGEYIPTDNCDDSTLNMVARYNDIEDVFPMDSFANKKV